MEIKIVGAAILRPALPDLYVPDSKIKGCIRHFRVQCNGHSIIIYCDVPLLLLPVWGKYIPNYNIIVHDDNGKINIRLIVNGKGNIYTVDVAIRDDLCIYSDDFFYRVKSI